MALDRSEKELLLREFRLNGFVILRNLLPPDLVTRMYEDLAPVLATEYRTLQSGKSNIPLVDFSWRTGPIEFLPGSHLQPRSFQSYSFVQIPHVYPVAPQLRRGDALLRDGNLLHRGTPNLTDAPRPMLDQTYKIVREEADAASQEADRRPS
ncbi:MAG: hypothetical protein E2P04_06970 [Acidobacteria bacterium]|nr:MAG: hypothetical protein E2P04_06970 [Acidobacteriota bacterium]